MSAPFWTWDLLCKMEAERGGKKKNTATAFSFSTAFLAQDLNLDAQPSQTNGTGVLHSTYCIYM